MKLCIYCNPEEKKQVVPILDTETITICALGRTPIMNRRKMGQLQILDKVTKEISYVNMSHCPICGQPLYLNEE